MDKELPHEQYIVEDTDMEPSVQQYRGDYGYPIHDSELPQQLKKLAHDLEASSPDNE